MNFILFDLRDFKNILKLLEDLFGPDYLTFSRLQTTSSSSKWIVENLIESFISMCVY